MSKTDSEGRPLVNTPAEALEKIKEDYSAYRAHGTLSFARAKKQGLLSALEHVVRECDRALADAQETSRGDLATEWKKVGEFVRAQCGELGMWILLDEGKFHEAWSALMTAQGAAHLASRWLPAFEPAQHLVKHLDDIETIVFPRQTFISPAIIVDSSGTECSICHAQNHQCEHIAGELYNGEMAYNIIHKIEGVREISFVDNPASKRSRAFNIGGLDPLTGEPYGERSIRPQKKARPPKPYARRPKRRR